MKMRILPLVLMFLWTVPAMANDITIIQQAEKGKFNQQSNNRLTNDIVSWYRLRLSDDVSFRQAVQFMAMHKDWPNLGAIQIKAEKAITPSIPNGELIQFFNTHAPITMPGMRAYISALLATGQTQLAQDTLRSWWIKAGLSPDEQSEILNRFGKMLSKSDHIARMNYIIHDQYYTASRDLAKVLGADYQNLVEAKIALIENKSNANALLNKVPANLSSNEALQLARIQWRRKNNQDDGAMALLNQAPTYNNMSHPSDWWRERHIMARRLMEKGQWARAYQLVSTHRQQDGFAMAQAEFVAGWLALRKVNKPWKAFKHFEKLYNNVESPISRARGAYWSGLASDTLGYPDIAKQWYHVAAAHQSTYYGQMAAARVGVPVGVLIPTAITIGQTDIQNFNAIDRVQASKLLHRAGLHQDSKLFLLSLYEDKMTGPLYKMGADLAQNMDYIDTALRIAKKAEREDIIMPGHLFPVLKEAKTKQYAIHPAFNHAIMRQESAFDKQAQSHAGALGLMQLMPATAKETAQKAGMTYSKSRLTTDPSYNMTLGSLYIKQMLDRYDGYRPLAIAAYNAGPGRASSWLDEFGDPRDKNIDEADWIEGIPVYETRNYVQRVTEAINVYANQIK